MLRWLAVIGAAAGCTLIGANASARLKLRRDVLAEFDAAIRRIAIGITHTNRPIAELLRGCGERETGALFAALADDVAYAQTPFDAWGRRLEDGCAALSCLMEQDAKALTVFFSVLGVSERSAQLENALMAQETLALLVAEAEAAYAGKGRVYRTMGLLLGVGVGILLL